jgi:hypothetical protein
MMGFIPCYKIVEFGSACSIYITQNMWKCALFFLAAKSGPE